MNDLILSAHGPTDAVTLGFLPAARRLGLQPVILTDHPELHHAAYASWGNQIPDIIACDVTQPFAVIAALSCRAQPAALFSNSDHLQAATALAADYFGLPAKNWQAAYRVKNKAEMRAHLSRAGLDTVQCMVLTLRSDLTQLSHPSFPCILKPREGVASEDVILIYNREDLQRHALAFWAIHPDRALLLEEYLDGPLYTLETLGDGQRLQVLGSFATQLSPPPHFIETRLDWTPLAADVQEQVLQQLQSLGVGFGACHTEFVLTPTGPRLIEVNYRNIGDQCDLLLQDLLGIPLFEWVLRAHLGEFLPDVPAARRTATVQYLCASRSGTLTRVPAAQTADAGDVQLTFHPLRSTGEVMPLTYTNRDYLGVVRAIAPAGTLLDTAVETFSASLTWEMQA